LAKKDAASSSECRFLSDFTNLDVQGTREVFNPFFKLDCKFCYFFTCDPFQKTNNGVLAFDGCHDTPIEILHVFLLGVVKYLVRLFMKKLTPAQILECTARYWSFDPGALNIPLMQPEYLTKHYNNFIGKDFKVVLL
jgi:hypothetical protein